jgi:monolysocardiolipin acyltransferase
MLRGYRKLEGLCSHIMLRMDDPILWGILPLSYMFNPENHRWGLASHDLCFTNKYAYPPSLQRAY